MKNRNGNELYIAWVVTDKHPNTRNRLSICNEEYAFTLLHHHHLIYVVICMLLFALKCILHLLLYLFSVFNFDGIPTKKLLK